MMADRLSDQEAIAHFVAQARRQVEVLRITTEAVLNRIREHERVLSEAGAQLELFEVRIGSPIDDLAEVDALAENVIATVEEIERRVKEWQRTQSG